MRIVGESFLQIIVLFSMSDVCIVHGTLVFGKKRNTNVVDSILQLIDLFVNLNICNLVKGGITRGSAASGCSQNSLPGHPCCWLMVTSTCTWTSATPGIMCNNIRIWGYILLKCYIHTHTLAKPSSISWFSFLFFITFYCFCS